MRAIILSIFITILAACDSKSPVSNKLDKYIISNPTSSVELSKFTEFEWKHVYIFSPYTSKEQVCNTLNVYWQKCSYIFPANGVEESEYFMAFINSGSLVHREFHRRKTSDFCRQTCLLSLQKNNAIFKVQPYGSRYLLQNP